MEKQVALCSDRIKEAMKIREMRQIDLAKATGISKPAISQYVSGKYVPKQAATFLIAKALNVSEAWLMGYDVPMERVAPPPKADALTNSEASLVEAFRKLSNSKRKLAVDIVKLLSER